MMLQTYVIMHSQHQQILTKPRLLFTFYISVALMIADIRAPDKIIHLYGVQEEILLPPASVSGLFWFLFFKDPYLLNPLMDLLQTLRY